MVSATLCNLLSLDGGAGLGDRFVLAVGGLIPASISGGPLRSLQQEDILAPMIIRTTMDAIISANGCFRNFIL